MRKGRNNNDFPQTIYICINKNCMKKWIFVSSTKIETDGIDSETKTCKACNNLVEKESPNEITTQSNDLTATSKENVNLSPAIIPSKNEDVHVSATGITVRHDNSNQRKKNVPNLPKTKLPKDENIIHSTKKFTVFKCSKDECGNTWKSVHGWTEGYTQRCRKASTVGNLRIACGNPGTPIGIQIIRVDEDTAKNKPYPYWIKRVLTGRHNSSFCDMCAKMEKHGKGLCTNKTDVFIRNEGLNTEDVDYIEGPPPSELY